MSTLPFLANYSGQSTDELLSLEGQFRTDSLVLAFEAALMGRTDLTAEETAILAVEALEREVNNGGFLQFFMNSSGEYAAVLAPSLAAIGCPQTADLAQQAAEAVGRHNLQSAEAIEHAISAGGEALAKTLEALTAQYFQVQAEPIADRLFEYIKANRTRVRTSTA